MIRTQIQLTEKQVSELRYLAAQKGTSMAAIIREAVDRYMITVGHTDEDEQEKRALAAIGRFASGEKDISDDHDEYLAEAFLPWQS